MPDKFKDIYRIETTRLKAWYYTKHGKYFVTICIHRREEFFGEIIDKKMFLSDIGKIADIKLKETEKIRKNMKLDEYVIMPNHIHVIIVIINVETRRASSLQQNEQNHPNNQNKSKIQQQMSKISPKPGSLSVIIGSFKSAVTKTANAVGCLSNGINNKYPCKNFVWQSRFNDHIIRNNKSFSNICKYIRQNPENWDNDINNIKKENTKL